MLNFNCIFFSQWMDGWIGGYTRQDLKKCEYLPTVIYLTLFVNLHMILL